MTARPSHLRLAIFVSVLAIAAFVRFYCLTCSSLWHDEGNSWAVAQRSFDQIARDAAADIHPPGYYWLLKLWASPFAYSAWAIRSLSALSGIISVAVVYRIALEVGASFDKHRFEFALLASLLTSLNPFQVYYSQEARMYALLSLEGTAMMWALIAMGRRARVQGMSPAVARYAALYVLAAAAGLWTHYTFTVLLAAAGGAAVLWWLSSMGKVSVDGGVRGVDTTARIGASSPWKPFVFFLILNFLAISSYLPWVPTGIESLLSWPSQGGHFSSLEGIRLTLQTIGVGTVRTGPQLGWGWLLLVALLPVCGLWQLRRSDTFGTLLLWLLLPITVMFSFDLVNPSFVKFLLIVSPAWCLAAAACPLCLPVKSLPLRPLNQFSMLKFRAQTGAATVFRFPLSSIASGSIAVLVTVLALSALPPYYADPAARDNYAGMAGTVAALGDPEKDLVILNAAGQADVWRFYDTGVEFLPVPAERPPDRAKTEQALLAETADSRRVFALFWATEQSDREGIVENWLGGNAFKGWESWQGNVRFATYSMPRDLSCTSLDSPQVFGDVAELSQICLSQGQIAAGDTLLVGLRWRPLRTTDRRLKVSVQLLDSREQVVVQRDGEPAGGTKPTTVWQKDEIIADNHGLSLPPGTPPGDYRLIVAVYDAVTGMRLSAHSGDAVVLARPSIVRSEKALPQSILPVRHRNRLDFGHLEAIGFDYFRKAFAHAPLTALSAGDMLQVTLYWQAPSPLPADWPDDLELRLLLGDQTVLGPLAGGVFPTSQWRAGDLVRGTFEIQFDGSDSTLWLEVGNTRKRLGQIPVVE